MAQPSPAGWRAVTAAMPLMATARHVEIVSVGEDEAAVGESRADVIRYLGWHRITAKARQVKPLSRNVGDMLLYEASEAAIAMLVMAPIRTAACASCSSAGDPPRALERRPDPGMAH